MSENRTYLTTGQAAAYIGYAESTLEKLRCHGGGPTFLKPLGGRRVLYRVVDLDTWLLAGRRSSTSAKPEAS
jgi:hypothetical protein